MPEDPAVTPPESTRCPWCSTVAPAGATTCSSCGAALISSSEGSVPGVTSIDAEAVLRGKTTARPRGGLRGLLSGETGDTVDAPTAAELSSLAPPPVSVRMEMIRLELDAERQRLEAEAAGMAADAVAHGEISRIPPGVLPPQSSDSASPNGSRAAEDTSASDGAPASDVGTTPGTAATPPASAAPAANPTPGATSPGDSTTDSGTSAVR